MKPRANHRRHAEAPMNVDLPLEVIVALDAFCDNLGVSKKACVELALRNFLKSKGVQIRPSKE